MTRRQHAVAAADTVLSAYNMTTYTDLREVLQLLYDAMRKAADAGATMSPKQEEFLSLVNDALQGATP